MATTPARRLIRRILAWGGMIAGTVVVVAGVALYVAADTPWGHERVRRFALHVLSGAIHGTVEIGGLHGDLLHDVVLSDLSIADSSGAPFVSARRAEVHYSIADLLHKHLEFHDVVLDHPVVVLSQRPNGVWNYARIFPSSGAPSDTSERGFGSWIAMTNVRVLDGDITVRMPWRPDSALTAGARDSAIQAALSPNARMIVAAGPDGYEKTIAAHTVTTRVDSLRLADPDHPAKRAQFASLSADLALFRPPDADVRDLTGTLYLDTDSLWMPHATILMPASRISARVSYALASGDLHVRAHAGPVSVADARFADPQLPGDGSLSADVTVAWHGRSQRYDIRNLVARLETARAAGTIGVTIGDSLVLHDTDVRFSGVDTRLIERLQPGLSLPRQGIAAGHAIAAGGPGAMAIDAELAFADQTAGESDVTATGEIGRDHGGYRARHLVVHLAPLQVALGRIAMPSLPVGGTVTGIATIDGSTMRSVTAHADLEHRQGDAYSHFVADGDVSFASDSAPPSGDEPRARVVGDHARPTDSLPGRVRPTRLNVSAALTPLDLGTVGRFVPAAKLSGVTAGTVRVAGPMRDLEVQAQLAVPGAPDSSGLVVTGHLDLASPVLGYDLAATARLLDAHSVSTAAPHTSVTATASARGYGTSPATLHADLAADVRASVFDSVDVDSAHVRATADSGQLRVEAVHVQALATNLDVQGSFGLTTARSGSLTYRAETRSLAAFERFLPRDTGEVAPRPAVIAEAVARARADSAHEADTAEIQRAIAGTTPPPLSVDTPRAVRRDSLGGWVVATGTVTGNIKRFELTGDLAADSLIAEGNTARRVTATYHWSGAPSLDSAAAVTVHLDSALLAGFAIGALDAQVGYHRPNGTVHLSIRETPTRDFAADARFRYTPSETEIFYDTLNLRIDTTHWRATHPASVAWGTDGVEIRNVELDAGRIGRISANGLLATRRGSAGGLHAVVQNLELADLAALAQQDLPVTGMLSLKADMIGDTRHPQLRGTLSVSSATVRERPLPNLFLNYQYDTTLLQARAELAPKGAPSAPFAIANVAVPIDLGLGVSGSRFPDRPLRGDMHLDSLPLDLVPQFTNAVRDVGGRVTGVVTVGGTVAKPQPEGTLALERGSATIVASGTLLRDMTAHMRMTRDSVTVDSLVATTPSTKGSLRLAGSLDLTDRAVPVLDVTATARDARVLSTRERGRIDLDANLSVAGPTTAPYISGSTTIRNAVIYIPEGDGKDLVDVGDATVYYIADTSKADIRKLIPAKNVLLSTARMDVDVRVNRDTWVRNKDANVEAYTPRPITVHIDQAKKAIVVDGTVSTDRGEYAVLGKRFTINKGEAVFIGTPELNPTLQAQGEYDVPVPGREAIAIQINIGGTLDSLRLTLASDAQPPISQSDLLSYLAFSVPTSGITQQGQSSSSSLSGVQGSGGVVGAAGSFVQNQLAGEAMGVLTDQVKGDLARALGADVLDISTSNNYTDVAQTRSGAAFFQNTQVQFGKYFTPRTFVAIQGSVAPGAIVMHQFGSHFNVQLSAQPLYLLGQPTLSTNPSTPLTGVLGMTLTRTWRF
jgi:translocation and assembly module TamB